MSIKTKTLSLLFLLISISIFGQSPIAPKKISSSEIFERIKKLNFLGSALYIAAHPDDENTRLISYLANDVKARTAYLSITRGDGGQNLIGPELSELLGVIRTYELLQARKIDGGEQFFTRAVDFGYSKTPDETLAIWDKDKVLSDVVLTIRKFQPDIIINRFDHTTPGSTHGHHTASAMLSVEAFELAGKSSAYPEHFEIVEPWQPKRLFHNTSWWFYGSREKFEKAHRNDNNLLTIETGSYYPAYGLSNGEIAALSRSQHQSQGFGSIGNRGEEKEYVIPIHTEKENIKHLFDGIDTSWNRIEGGKAIGDILYKVEQDYDFKHPEKSVPELVRAYQLLKNRTDYWGVQKTKEIKDIILACSGFFAEAIATTHTATPGDSATVRLEAVNRSQADIKVQSISYKNKTLYHETTDLTTNKPLIISDTIVFHSDDSYTSPYWLQDDKANGLYRVDAIDKRGLPELEHQFPVEFKLLIEGEEFTIARNIAYKYNNPALGEVYQPFQLLPQATVSVQQGVYIFPDTQPQQVTVTVKAGKANIEGKVHLDTPDNWIVSDAQPFRIEHKGAESTHVFTVTPPAKQDENTLKAIVQIDGKTFDHQQITIDYPHIPLQQVLLPAEAKLARVALQKENRRIGYIAGAGDAIPESLEQIGYEVTPILPELMDSSYLSQFDVIILGIRAYNVDKGLLLKQDDLFSFVKNGGTLITQYNVSRGLENIEIAPYNLTLSRDRVTDETAAVTFPDPKHRVLNEPNKITLEDFENWVQERGLYFPDEWAKEFTPILKMNDPDEKPTKGALLIAKYGKGHVVYTGLSFFRQLPAGVPGAYRLFVNLLGL